MSIVWFDFRLSFRLPFLRISCDCQTAHEKDTEKKSEHLASRVWNEFEKDISFLKPSLFHWNESQR